MHVFQSPEYTWSEEYQEKLLSKHFEAFDMLRNESFFIGEMIWNFADFNTAQSKYSIMFHKVVVQKKD
jgi:beta-glucuronidase